MMRREVEAVISAATCCLLLKSLLSAGSIVTPDKTCPGAVAPGFLCQDVEAGLTAPENSPEDVAHAFIAAWNRHDMKALAGLFAQEAHFVNVVGVWWRNREEIEAAHRATHETIFRDSQLEGEVSSVQAIGPGVVAVHVTWRLMGALAPGGMPAGTREGILLLVLAAEGTGWRIRVAQNTDIVPGAIAPAARAEEG